MTKTIPQTFVYPTRWNLFTCSSLLCSHFGFFLFFGWMWGSVTTWKRDSCTTWEVDLNKKNTLIPSFKQSDRHRARQNFDFFKNSPFLLSIAKRVCVCLCVLWVKRRWKNYDSWCSSSTRLIFFFFLWRRQQRRRLLIKMCAHLTICEWVNDDQLLETATACTIIVEVLIWIANKPPRWFHEFSRFRRLNSVNFLCFSLDSVENNQQFDESPSRRWPKPSFFLCFSSCFSALCCMRTMWSANAFYLLTWPLYVFLSAFNPSQECN